MGLLQKLQIKDPSNFYVVNCPDELNDLLSGEDLKQQVDFEHYQAGGILLFVWNTIDLHAKIEGFIRDSDADNHWMAFPKRTSKIPTDLRRDHGWEKLSGFDWIAVRQVSINDQWSALRFRPKANVKEIKRGTDYPGIDSKKKIVTIPSVLENRLKAEGLLEVFQLLNFTRRKEAIISILEAKKPETLERRINKIIEALV